MTGLRQWLKEHKQKRLKTAKEYAEILSLPIATGEEK